MKRFDVTFTVSVLLTVNDEDALDRVQTEEWRNSLYDLDEKGAVEMLARCIGIQGWRLSNLDGWADMPDEAVTALTEVEFEGYSST